MKTLALIGTNGKAGRFLVHEALQNGYKVRVLVRDIKKLKYFTHYLSENVEIIIGDVHSKETLEELVQGSFAVINTVGHLKNQDNFYSSITQNIIEVMGSQGVERYLGVMSGATKKPSDKRNFIHSLISNFMYKNHLNIMLDKENTLKVLESSSLIWTVFRLPKIKEVAKNKKINVDNFSIRGFNINNRDFAKFIINQVENDLYHYKSPFVWQ